MREKSIPSIIHTSENDEKRSLDSRIIIVGVLDRVLLDELGSTAVLNQAHVGSEGGVRDPLAGGARAGLLHHAVDLLEGQALGLGHEEVGVDEAAGAEGAPDEEDFGAEVRVALVRSDHVWGDDGDDAVPEPVRGG